MSKLTTDSNNLKEIVFFKYAYIFELYGNTKLFLEIESTVSMCNIIHINPNFNYYCFWKRIVIKVLKSIMLLSSSRKACIGGTYVFFQLTKRLYWLLNETENNKLANVCLSLYVDSIEFVIRILQDYQSSNKFKTLRLNKIIQSNTQLNLTNIKGCNLGLARYSSQVENLTLLIKVFQFSYQLLKTLTSINAVIIDSTKASKS
mmetsp:Transcript_21269/g.52048  ORF Transcript_21269/g.52048 Transcript_21269/m.52048 type:complete len:203 (-) Transcript_21269:370-978(-)